MDQNNGLKAKISKEETRSTLTMDIREIIPQLNRISLPDQTSHMGTIRIMEDHMFNALIIHSMEAMENDLEVDLSTIRMETGETVEFFFVPRRLKGETSHKIIHTANQEVINVSFLFLADLTINLRLVLQLTNKNSHQTIARRHLLWSTSTTDDTISRLSDFCPLNY